MPAIMARRSSAPVSPAIRLAPIRPTAQGLRSPASSAAGMRAHCGRDSEQGDCHESGNQQTLHGKLRWFDLQCGFAPPHYRLRSRANVACVTYHDLVFDMEDGSIGACRCRTAIVMAPPLAQVARAKSV